MKSIFRFYPLVFIYLSGQLYGQNDSIISSLDTISGNTEKMEYLEMTINSQWRSNPKKVLVYATLFDSIANLDGGEAIHMARAANLKGMANYALQKYDEAILFYLESASLSEDLGSMDKLQQIYSNIAACYNVRNDFENTEKYFLKGLDIAQKEKNETWQANIHNNLSVIYMQNQHYAKADKSIDFALAHFLEEKDSIMAGITYMNSGNAKIYTEKYNEAIEQYTKSLEFIKKSQFPLVNAVSKTGIGIALTKQENYTDALTYLQEGLETAKSINHYGQMMESYKALADFYSETANYKEAYTLSLESQKLKDSVLTAEQDANMAEALTKFETEKKEAEIKLLGVENEKNKQQQKLYAILAFAGLLLTSLIGFFYFKNRKKNALLAKQKKLLEATVDEKNVLLKETHHRVKNSFQIVSSLLYLQSETIEDKEAKLAMQEAQNRVRSMVLIHQKLYSKDQLVGIDTKEYIDDLIEDIFQGHQFEGNAIHYSSEVESMVLGIETITPIGLIINELITNVIKHAFPKVTASSNLHVSLKKDNDILQLHVNDNGIGMQNSIDENSFGLTLIKALSKKLKAHVSFPEQEQGTSVLVSIHRFTEL